MNSIIRWNPDAIVFDSYQQYGTPSYWVQQFFRESSGATLLNATFQTAAPGSLVASAIAWQNSVDEENYLRIKVMVTAFTLVVCFLNYLICTFKLMGCSI